MDNKLHVQCKTLLILNIDSLFIIFLYAGTCRHILTAIMLAASSCNSLLQHFIYEECTINTYIMTICNVMK